MIKRYQDQQIETVWSSEHKLQLWFKIEQLVLKYWFKQQLFPLTTYQNLEKIQPDFLLYQKLEKENQHEIAAFVKMLSLVSPAKEGKWWHYGLTSNDVLDSAQNYLLKESYQIVEQELKQFLALLKKIAYREKNQISLGRTHGMAAEPVTIGWKFALWFREFNNHLKRCQIALEEINYVKILGPTGISAHFSLQLGELVANHLKMKNLPAANQIMSRDHHITFFHALTNLAVSLEKLATEIRNLGRSEINEVSEGFSAKQQGSSAMPHKKNPILAENICALMKILQALSSSFYQTNLLWHERDLTNSAIERVNIPDFFHLLVTGLKRANLLLQKLQINSFQIKKNLENHQIALFSHKILLLLIKKSELDRQEAYQLLQRASFLAQQKKISFLAALKQEKILNYLSMTDLKQCFVLKNFFHQLDSQFQAIFN